MSPDKLSADPARNRNVGDPAAVAPLIDHHERIAECLATLQTSGGQGLVIAAAALQDVLRRHLAVVQHYIQPLFDRMLLDADATVTWLPEQHERHALRLLQLLHAEPEAQSIDTTAETARSVRIAVAELEERILPDITRAIGPRTSELLGRALLYSLA